MPPSRSRTANIKINYGGGGSGKGRQDLADMVTDFAGSDSPFKDADLAKVKGGDVLYFPVVLGAVSLSYNISGVTSSSSRPTRAKIFQRDIKKWNDAGDRRRQPGRQAARHRHRRRSPRRWFGHDRHLHEVPRRRIGRRVEAQERLDGRVAGRYASGSRQRRRRAARQVDVRRDWLRRPQRCEGVGPHLRERQERRRQVRRADDRVGLGRG